MRTNEKESEDRACSIERRIGGGFSFGRFGFGRRFMIGMGSGAISRRSLFRCEETPFRTLGVTRRVRYRCNTKDSLGYGQGCLHRKALMLLRWAKRRRLDGQPEHPGRS